MTTRQILRRFVEHAESYNRCMFAKKKVSEVLLADVLSTGYPSSSSSSFALHSLEQCSVVSIISPQTFTIQLERDRLDAETFLTAMNDYYNSIVDLQISAEYLRTNLLCVTWDETASLWHRSQVMEYDLLDDTVNVFFVDYNSWEEHVSRTRLRFILTKYSSRPVQVITCRLASIRPCNENDQWNDVASKTFQNIVQNRRCDVEPVSQADDQTFSVNLFAVHDEAYVCVNDFLIHCQMARPSNDLTEEKHATQIEGDGRPMHPVMALYWQAGEAMQDVETDTEKLNTDRRSSVSTESLSLKFLPLTKIVRLDETTQLIFARYNSYIMLPWCTISSILPQLDQETIQSLARRLGFKPIVIDPLSHPLLCSQLLKFISSPTVSSQLSLYSIDCVRRIFQRYSPLPENIADLLDQARLAEASEDTSFWQLQ